MKNIWVLLFMPVSLCAQKNDVTLYDKYMQGQADLYHFNGNILVAKNGNIIYHRSFGYADYQTITSLDSNSIFDCGSIAKEFTAAGILLLKDKGKISYGDTLRKFFPELPYSNVTIQQLLTHTSGMANGFGLVARHFDQNKIAYNDDLIRLLAAEQPPLLFKPGEDLVYSGTAFNLLASIIEKISGQSFKKYMEEKVFKPLGMLHTQVANGQRSPKSIPGYAWGYVYSDSLKRYVRSDSLGSDWTTSFAGITGEGMVVTTTGDLLKWDQALKNHRLLTETTQREMLSPQSSKVMPNITFGYGIRVGKNDLGNYIFHNGYYPGYLSMHLRYVDENITVIVLSNNESRADFIADALSSMTIRKEIVLPVVHKDAGTVIATGTHIGKYMMRLVRPPFMAIFPVEFVTKNGTLYIHPVSGADKELKPESPNKFFFADGTDQQIEFERNNDTSRIKVWHTAWGVRKELKRIE